MPSNSENTGEAATNKKLEDAVAVVTLAAVSAFFAGLGSGSYAIGISVLVGLILIKLD